MIFPTKETKKMSSILPQHVQELSLELNSLEKNKPGLRISTKLRKWLRLVLSDPSSRNLFMFLLVNLSFAFVELFYGMWTNSLGLISDAFHMFFDCTALLAGLVATVVSKWQANERFSYGYVRAEVIAGFVNALFLLFIAFFIFAEAIERAFEPPEVKHDRLLVISVAGFVVNLIGIFVFHHGGQEHSHCHGHSHHGHSHDHSHFEHSHHGHAHHSHSHDHSGHVHSHDHPHSHDEHGHSHSHDGYGHSHSHDGYGHSHSHDGHVHSHSHDGHAHGHSHLYGHDHSHEAHHGGSNVQIMQGIFLHILADTLGSVGVIISSILIQQFGWMISDPICSMFIAVLITMSVFPLMRDSLGVLMQRHPPSLDHTFPSTLQKILDNDSIAQVLECHVWTLCSGVFISNLRVEVFPGSDMLRLRSMIKNYLSQAGIQQSYVELVYQTD